MNKLTNDLKGIRDLNRMIADLQLITTGNLSEDEQYDILDSLQSTLEAGVIPDNSADNYTIYREVVKAEFNELQILLSSNFVNYTPLTKEDALSCLPKLYKSRQALFICLAQYNLSRQAFEYKFQGKPASALISEDVKQSVVQAGLQLDTFYDWFIESIVEGAEYSQGLIPDKSDETVDIGLMYDACNSPAAKFLLKTLQDELDLVKLSDYLTITVEDIWGARI